MLLVGDWTVHENFDRLTRANEESHITPRAMDVLVHLAKRQGKLVTKEELLDTFWRGSISGDNAVHKTMAELRRIFGDSSKDPQYIRTYPKRGYRLIAEVMLKESPDMESDSPATILNATPVTIAVLPFLNFISDQQNQNFGDALSEDIANYFGRSRLLSVISHTSSFRFRGDSLDTAEIGLELNATHLVEGSVRSQDGMIRATVQLVNAASGKQDWAMRYDRYLEDSLAMQDELASTIVASIHEYLGLRTSSSFEPTMDQSYLKELF
jgi:TolB-like protein